MPQVIIKRNSVRRVPEEKNSSGEILGDEIFVTGDQVVVNSDSSVKVTFAESEILVDLAG
ncbi:MAG: hypothetical protein ABW044_05440 [Cellvibrio sp.]